MIRKIKVKNKPVNKTEDTEDRDTGIPYNTGALEDNTIYLPGECYRNSWRYAISNTTPKNPVEYCVVQGTVYSESSGRRISHGWVEHGDYATDPTQGITMKKDDYHKLVRAIPERAYTVEQYGNNMARLGVHPPWTAEEVGNDYVPITALGRGKRSSYRPSYAVPRSGRSRYTIGRVR